MTIPELLELFRSQLERETLQSCVLGPTGIKSSAPTVYVLPRKISLRHEMQGDDDDQVVLLSLKIQLRASIEGGGTGLKLALDASTRLALFLAIETNLEDAQAAPISDIVFAAMPAEEDAYADNENPGQLFGVTDTYVVELSVPRSALQ